MKRVGEAIVMVQRIIYEDTDSVFLLFAYITWPRPGALGLSVYF